jgi:hypothetical protein
MAQPGTKSLFREAITNPAPRRGSSPFLAQLRAQGNSRSAAMESDTIKK